MKNVSRLYLSLNGLNSLTFFFFRRLSMSTLCPLLSLSTDSTLKVLVDRRTFGTIP